MSPREDDKTRHMRKTSVTQSIDLAELINVFGKIMNEIGSYRTVLLNVFGEHWQSSALIMTELFYTINGKIRICLSFRHSC